MTGARQIQHSGFAARTGEAAALQEAVSTHKGHSCGPVCCPLWEAHADLFAAQHRMSESGDNSLLITYTKTAVGSR